MLVDRRDRSMLADRKDRSMLVERGSAGEERIWVAGKIDRCLWSVDRLVKKGSGSPER